VSLLLLFNFDDDEPQALQVLDPPPRTVAIFATRGPTSSLPPTAVAGARLDLGLGTARALPVPPAQTLETGDGDHRVLPLTAVAVADAKKLLPE
jgi:hypothetical protein